MNHQRDVMGIVTYSGVQELKHTIATIATETLEYLEERRSAEYDKILGWISELDFHAKYKESIMKHHTGTCKWLLEGEAFRGWMYNKENSTLWCSGIPGAGKTTVLSIAIDHVLMETKKSHVAIAYAYCNYQNSTTRSASNIIASLTRQLAQQSRKMHPGVMNIWREYRQIIKAPDDEEWMLLASMLSESFEQTYIFIDALDECPEVDQDGILSFVKRLEPVARVFLTSRPNLLPEYIARSDSVLSRMVHTEVAANDSDLRSYLGSQLDQCRKMRRFARADPELRGDVIEKLVQQADGMFLLPHLQIQDLCGRATLDEVRNCLRSLPQDVNACYEKSLALIEERHRSEQALAKRALSYVLFARRPFNTDEFTHALAMHPGQRTLQKASMSEITYIMDLCAGLMRVDEKSGNVALVHHTLQEYLMKHQDRFLPFSEAEMAASCVTYLSLDELASGPCEDQNSLERRLARFSFLDYASHHWGEHASAVSSPDELASLIEFMSQESKLSQSLQVLHIPRHRVEAWHDHYPKEHTSLHAAAYWGLVDVIAALNIVGMAINDKDSNGDTALHLAAQQGHTTAVQMLLGKGALVNRSNNRGETALICASKNDRVEVVEVLLANNASVHHLDIEGWTSLEWAITGDHTEMVNLLLAHHATVAPEQDLYNKCLILAAEKGTDEIVRLLLDLGAQVNWQGDDTASSPLHWTIAEGHESTARILLEHGADTNLPDVYDNRPIHWAIPYSGIVKLVLNAGADVDAKNNKGHTALHWAAVEGLDDAVGLLLAAGASVNLTDDHGLTPLHGAALKGHLEVVDRLLRCGADPQRQDEDGWTPLYAAALMRHDGVAHLLEDKTLNSEDILNPLALQRESQDTMALLRETAAKKGTGSTVVDGLRGAVNSSYAERVRVLLKQGADVNAEGAIGGAGTALSTAAWLGSDDIVQVLLDYGVDVNKRERSGQLPIHYAVRKQHHGIVVKLAQNGADVNSKVNGWSPLLLAAERAATSIAKALVNGGADVESTDYHGRKALHLAAIQGKPSLVKCLLDGGATVDAQDHWGRTPLICAIEKRESMNAIKLLLERGADVVSALPDGSTSFHVAAYVGRLPIIQLLLENGADIDAQAANGMTALHIAVLRGDDKAVRLLIARGAGTKRRWRIAGDNDAAEIDDESLDENEEGTSESETSWQSDSETDDEGEILDAEWGHAKDEGVAKYLSRHMNRLLRDLGDLHALGNTEGGLTATQVASLGDNGKVKRLLRKHEAEHET